MPDIKKASKDRLYYVHAYPPTGPSLVVVRHEDQSEAMRIAQTYKAQNPTSRVEMHELVDHHDNILVIEAEDLSIGKALSWESFATADDARRAGFFPPSGDGGEKEPSGDGS
jgi:hypothetical protein